MIRLNITEKDLENEESAKRIVSKILQIQYLRGNTDKIKEDYSFYNGEMPRKKDTDKIINLSKPIVDTATQTFIGQLPDIVSSKKSDSKKISLFTQKIYNNAIDKEIFNCSKASSISGSGYICLYSEQGDTLPRIRALDSQKANVIYDCSLARKPICAYNIVETELCDEKNKWRRTYIVYIYTSKNIYAYKSYEIPTLAKKPITIYPYYAFISNVYDNDLAMWIEKETNLVEHKFNGIPIIEFPNNEERISDFECVKELIAQYNTLTNNRTTNVEDIVNYVLMIKNARLGNDDETKQALDMFKENRVLALEGENVDAKFLSNPLNQTELSTLAKDIIGLIHYISRVPDLSSVDFSQNASDPIIKIKTKPLLDLCKEKEKYFTLPYIHLISMILDFVKDNDIEEYNKINFDIDAITLKYSHTLPSNDSDMINMIVNLNNAGLIDPKTALQEITWIPSVEQYIKGVNEWNEIVDKRKQNNNTKSGINEFNLKEQNEKVVDNHLQDNKKNYNLGLANKLSENKVE